MPKLEKDRLEKLYNKYQSLQLVADEVGYTKEGIRCAMQRLGIAVNKPVRYSFDERFFTKDAEEVFYWAGFIAADGCLKKHGNSDALDIALSSKDEYHLELFKRDINSTHPIHKSIIKNSKHNSKWNDSEKVEIRVLSKYLPEDLARFNITQRKTHTYTFPEWLIEHSMVNHFMRGYFDGDGSWFIGSSRKTPQVFFSLRGTVGFLKTYRSILEKYGLQQRDKDPRINNGIGVLEYGGNGVAVKIRDFLYRDANVYMERKYNIVKDVVLVERLDVTPQKIIELINELGSQKEVAKRLGCSGPNLSRIIKEFNIRDEVAAARGHRQII